MTLSHPHKVLQLPPAEGEDHLHLLVSTVLSRQYLSARPIDSSEPVEVARDADGRAILFTLGDAEGGGKALYAIVWKEGTTSGWQAFSLTDSLEGEPTCFACHQGAGGDIQLAVVTERSTGDVALRITPPLPRDPDTFRSPAITWVERPHPDVTSVQKVELGVDDVGGRVALVAAEVTDSTGVDMWWVDTDPEAEPEAWSRFALPLPAEEVLAIVLGRVGGTWGAFVLHDIDDSEQSLEFIGKPGDDGLSLLLAYPLPDGVRLRALATVAGAASVDPDANPCCADCHGPSDDLYAAGDGVYLYPAAQTQTPQCVAPRHAIVETHEDGLFVSRSSAGVRVWVIHGDQRLTSFTGDGADSWSAPYLLARQVGQVAPVWWGDGHEAFLVRSTRSEKLTHLLQDATTGAWSEHDVRLPDSGPVLAYDAWMTTLEMGADTMPEGFIVRLRADHVVQLYANGACHWVGPHHDTELRCDALGELILMIPTADGAAPVLTATVDGWSRPARINPGAALLSGLRNMTFEEFRDQVGTDGPSLDEGSLRHAHRSLHRIIDHSQTHGGLAKEVASDDENAGTFPPQGPGDSGMWEQRDDDTTATLTHANDPIDWLAGAVSATATTAHSLLRAAVSEAKEVVSFSIRALEDVPGIGLLVKVGETIVRFVAEGVSQLMGALAQVLDLVGYGLAKAMIQFGLLPDPVELVRTQRVLTNSVRQALHFARRESTGLADVLIEHKDLLESAAAWAVTQPLGGLPPQLQHLERPRRDKPKPPAIVSSVYHLTHSLDSLTSLFADDDDDDDDTAPSSEHPELQKLIDRLAGDVEDGIAQAVQLTTQLIQQQVSIEGYLVGLLHTLVKESVGVGIDLGAALLGLVDYAAERLLAFAESSVDIPFLSGFYRAIAEEGGGDPGAPKALDAIAMVLSIAINGVVSAASDQSGLFAQDTYGLDTATGEEWVAILAPEGFSLVDTAKGWLDDLKRLMASVNGPTGGGGEGGAPRRTAPRGREHYRRPWRPHRRGPDRWPICPPPAVESPPVHVASVPWRGRPSGDAADRWSLAPQDPPSSSLQERDSPKPSVLRQTLQVAADALVLVASCVDVINNARAVAEQVATSERGGLVLKCIGAAGHTVAFLFSGLALFSGRVRQVPLVACALWSIQVTFEWASIRLGIPPKADQTVRTVIVVARRILHIVAAATADMSDVRRGGVITQQLGATAGRITACLGAWGVFKGGPVRVTLGVGAVVISGLAMASGALIRLGTSIDALRDGLLT